MSIYPKLQYKILAQAVSTPEFDKLVKIKLSDI